MSKDSKKPAIRFKGFTDDWEQRKLNELAEFNPKCNLPNSFEYVDLESVVGTEMISSRYEIKENAPSRAQRLAKKGDVFYQTVRPYQRNNYLFDKEENNYVFSTGYAQLRPNCNSRYLLNLLQTDSFVNIVLNNCTGTSYPAINSSDLGNIHVTTTKNIREQTKIGEIFYRLDNLITLHQRKLDKLKNIKKALLEKMFPRNGENIPEVRFKGFSDDWEQRKLEDVVDFLDTKRKPLKESDRINGPYPYYGASGIVDYINGYLFDEELILLSEDGANITDRNYPVCFLASGKYWVNNHAHVLKTKIGNENNFVCNSLERKNYSQFNSGMAMPKLNQDVCRNIPILCPKFKEQKKIGDYFRNLDKLITLHQRKLDKLKNIKKALLEKMFV